MADPISLMAIAGLVYAGRKLSKPVEMYESNSGDNTKLENNEFNDRDITIRDAYLGPASPLIEPQITLKATDEAGNFGAPGLDQGSFPFRSVIRYEDHDCVVGNSDGIELVEDQPETVVHPEVADLRFGKTCLLDPFPYGFAIDQPQGFF